MHLTVTVILCGSCYIRASWRSMEPVPVGLGVEGLDGD